MKTQKEVLEAVKAGKKSEAIDGRDFGRLVNFFPFEEWEHFGYGLKENSSPSDLPPPKPWTEEVILEQLRGDLDFAFKKALGQRGLSSSSMFEVIRMWMWVLDDPLQHHQEYAQYGLPLYKEVAVKYGLENPIGKKSGSEVEYACE